MEKFSRSWGLTKSALSLLRADKELIALPFLSFLATMLTVASFAGPLYWSIDAQTVDGATSMNPGPITFVLGFLAYLVLAYVTIFFNTALICAADERMRGGNPSLGSALNGALERASRILPWAIVSATVSMILKSIEQRAGFLGRIVAGIAGLAWSLVTFLVLPIIVIEGLGVRAALSRSTELFKRAWGEQVIANVGIGIVAVIAVFAGVPVLIGGLMVGGLVAGIAVAAFATWVGLVFCVAGAASGIFQTALYHYAANGMPPAAFATVDLEHAFREKRRIFHR